MRAWPGSPRRAHALSRWLSLYHRRSPTIARLAAVLAAASGQRAGFRRGAVVLACTAAGLLADAGVLAACFGLAGLPVPWRGLLFAYAAGQLAGRVVPLPGGLGGVEGGVLGALTLTGTLPAAAAAAVLVYRVAGYWAVGTAGTAVAVTTRRRNRQDGTTAAATTARDGGMPSPTPGQLCTHPVAPQCHVTPPKCSTPHVHHRVTAFQRPVHNVPCVRASPRDHTA